MSEVSRRDFLRGGTLGLAAAGLTLRADAQVTPASGSAKEAAAVAGLDPPKLWKSTEDNILGPFHRSGVPFRGKVTPPLEPGTVLLVSGRVWSVGTRKPLAGAVLDIWQANDKGRYDNDDPRNPPQKGVFTNRTRLVTDEKGFYEFETILPGRYKIGPDTWRPRHIHYMVRHEGHQRLITQLYFRGEKFNDTDAFIKKSLIIGLNDHKTPVGAYKSGRFDIVLAKA